MKDRRTLELILGIILLIPPVIGVVGFLLGLLTDINILKGVPSLVWNGYIVDSGGFSSSMPLYFGLMAIAGAYLISNSYKK